MRQLKITKSITNRESASLDKYLQEIGREDLITVEEEVELAQRIRKGDRVALEKLTRANLRFVVSVAKQYQNQGLSLPDLINEGNLGLIKAAEKFDETRGFKFISYAVWWIRQSILQALAEQSRIVRLPLNQVGSLNKISKAFSKFEQENERRPSPEELADELEIPVDKISDTLKVSGRHISVDAPFVEGEDNSLLDVLVNDFYALYQKYGCNMQFGGDDQWSNMLGGTELIRRKLGKNAYAMTINLLLNSEGKKMGKTQSGAVWLSAEKTSPYDFYQYWRNVDDGDVIKCLKMLKFLPLEEIDELAKLEGSEINKAKEILAHELTELVHGKEEADKAQEAARAIFSNKTNTDNMPSTTLTEADFADGEIGILDLMKKCGLIPSNGEGRRLIQQGGVSVDDEKVTDVYAKIAKSDFEKGYVVIKKGKKVYHKAILG